MKKLLLSAAITAAIFGGQAEAALNNTQPTAANVGTPNEVWISGSSAATPFVEKSVIADCTGNVYKYANGTADFTWICDSSIAPGTVNVVHKRDGGGSITGVNSALGTVLPTYANLSSLYTATCGTPAAGTLLTTCTATAITTAAHAGDIDLADVDAAQFELPANGGVASTAGLTNNPVATQVFGVVVNQILRDAMQDAMVGSTALPASCTASAAARETEACVPNLTTEQISAIFGAGRLTDWFNVYFGGTDNVLQSLAGGATSPLNTDIHYCSRTAGSGTLAAFNIKFENQCFKGNEAIATSATQLIGKETDPLSGNQKVVHSMSGSGDLENCLVGLNNGVATGTFTPYPAMTNGVGPRWAIGIMGTDRNATNAKPYRFLKIDGYAPTNKNVVEGKYRFWAELVNVSKGAVSTKPLAIDILANLGSASQITSLNQANVNFVNSAIGADGVTGFLGTALNASYLPTYDLAIAPGTLINGAYDVARPVNLYTHATFAGSSLSHCRAPSLPAGAKAIQAFTK